MGAVKWTGLTKLDPAPYENKIKGMTRSYLGKLIDDFSSTTVRDEIAGRSSHFQISRRFTVQRILRGAADDRQPLVPIVGKKKPQAMKSICLCFLFSAIASIASAQVRYQFDDTPRPEADVIIVDSALRVRGGGELWLVGRVFNRGLKPARNVRVLPNLTNRYGTPLPAYKVMLYPSDVPPTSFANFEGRVLLSADTDVIANATVAWDP